MKAILILMEVPEASQQSETGIKSKASTPQYVEGWERIFGQRDCSLPKDDPKQLN